ncbi:MAG: Hsp20/alpha crystallin family protein [Deltaproteobacteria bacterium]|nr:Hsp20/alpha crystallin family protein [Deltaproteobacteria bacterium]
MKNLMASPFRDLNRMQRQFDDLFGESASFQPSVDVEEKDNHYLLRFDMPGVKKGDIKIELQDNVLTISGERRDEREEKDKDRTIRSERFYGVFQRSFTLPPGIKAEQLEADYRDGVLHVAVPKIEVATSQQIKIGEGKAGFWDKLLGRDGKKDKAA